MAVHHRHRPARVRCADCGSTRVRGIVLGYFEGRLEVDDDGRVIVGVGSFEAYDEHDIAGGSVICEACSGGRYRVERAHTETVLR